MGRDVSHGCVRHYSEDIVTCFAMARVSERGALTSASNARITREPVARDTFLIVRQSGVTPNAPCRPRQAEAHRRSHDGEPIVRSHARRVVSERSNTATPERLKTGHGR
jgi:hypothetical protein